MQSSQKIATKPQPQLSCTYNNMTAKDQKNSLQRDNSINLSAVRQRLILA